MQLILPNITTTGPVTARQDRSYLHHVILDPKNKFLVIPDLGGDRCRVFIYDKHTIAPIAEVDGLTTNPGTGPRHGFFRIMASGETFFFFNGELSQKVYSYRVKYKKTGLAFTKVFEIPAIDGDLPATKAPTSEIAMSVSFFVPINKKPMSHTSQPDKRFLVVSNREKSFPDSPLLGTGPSDTLSTFAIHEDGTLELVQLAPSGGWMPRQFSFNKVGDKIAVGHQRNKTVVIWKRDLKSGRIVLEDEGGKVGEVTLTGAVVSTIWDE